MIFLYYIIIGLIVTMLRVIICEVRCKKRGIDMITFNKTLKTYSDTTTVSILIGLITWPYRIILFNKYEKNIIDSCLKNKKELEES